MAKTEFEVFAQKLATYFQGTLSPEEFTRTLFKKIYLNPNGDTLLHDMEPRTLRGYFYGEHNITTLAKKINKDLDWTLSILRNLLIQRRTILLKACVMHLPMSVPESITKTSKRKLQRDLKRLFVMLRQQSASVRKQQNLFLSLKK